MKFFVPCAESDEDAEKKLAEFKQRIGRCAGIIKSDRIYSLKYIRDDKPVVAMVGGLAHETDRMILAIFKQECPDLYLLYTNYSHIEGEFPIMVGNQPGVHFELFEE